MKKIVLLNEEKKVKHNFFRIIDEQILKMSDIARKEGLIALEDEGNGMRSLSDLAMMNDLTLLVVDGTDPEMIERLALMKYFSKKNDAYKALVDLMSIYGMLGIQAGTNPRIILEMMNNLMPEDVVFEENYFELSHRNQDNEKEVEIYELCQ